MNETPIREQLSILNDKLKVEPQHADTHHQMGLLHLQQGNLQQAEACLQKAIEYSPMAANYKNNLGVLYIRMRQFDKAKKAFQESFQQNPNDADSCNNLGTIALEERDLDTAISFYEKAIQLRPRFSEAHNNLGSVFMKLNQQKKSYEQIKKALQLNPNSLLSLNNLGLLEKHFGNTQASISVFKKVLLQNPAHLEALCNLADLYRMQEKYQEAENLLHQVLEISPDHTDAHYFLGLIHYNQGHSEKAEEHLSKAKRADRPSLYELGMISHSQLAQAKWDEWEVSKKEAIAIFQSGQHFEPVNPFIGQSLFQNLEDYCTISQKWGKTFESKLLHPPYPRAPYQHDKLRIGYLSPNFTTHPVGLQINDLFARHDRDKFSIYGFPTRSFRSEQYYKICNACDHVKELFDISFDRSAEIIREFEIDILVDLAGPTDNHNYDTLSRQPAPVQCHMLGATGTLGAPFIQYVLTTRTIADDSFLKYYTEIPVRLPDTEIARSGFELPAKKPYRSEWGLPEDAVVMLAHHTYYRIDPQTFQVWMQILHRVPQAVLWIKCGSKLYESNIKKTATQSGIDPKRIITYEQASLTTYWQHQLADFFLDSFSFSSGTCVFFCAWTGVPVLTCLGPTPQSRVGASFCKATGVPEQIANTPEEYLEKAIEWSNNPKLLKSIREALLSQRETAPLFSPDAYVLKLENAYEKIWKHFIHSSNATVIDID